MTGYFITYERLWRSRRSSSYRIQYTFSIKKDISKEINTGQDKKRGVAKGVIKPKLVQFVQNIREKPINTKII